MWGLSAELAWRGGPDLGDLRSRTMHQKKPDRSVASSKGAANEVSDQVSTSISGQQQRAVLPCWQLQDVEIVANGMRAGVHDV